MPAVEKYVSALSQHPGNPQLQRFDSNAGTFSTIPPQEADSLSFKNVKVLAHPQDQSSFIFRDSNNIYRYNNPGLGIVERHPDLGDSSKKFDISVHDGSLYYKETKPLVLRSGVGSSHQAEEAELERRAQILHDYLKHSLPQESKFTQGQMIDHNMEWVKGEDGKYFERRKLQSSQLMYEDPNMEWVKGKDGKYFQRPINQSPSRKYEDPDPSTREKSPSEKDEDEGNPPSV
jgi:hypothetical protein